MCGKSLWNDVHYTHTVDASIFEQKKRVHEYQTEN